MNDNKISWLIDGAYQAANREFHMIEELCEQYPAVRVPPSRGNYVYFYDAEHLELQCISI